MDKNERLLQLLLRLINRGTPNQFKLLFHKFHEADIAEALNLIPSDKKTLFFNRIHSNKTVNIFEEMDIHSQIEIIQHFKLENAVNMIEKMDKDDAVDLLEALLDEDAKTAQQLLGKMAPDDRIELNQLLSYKENSAGALMTTNLVTIPEQLTVDEALEQYRRASPKDNNIGFYLFIVNEHQIIKGVVSLRKLLLAPRNKRVKDIRNSYPIKVDVNADQEDVARLFQKYRYIVLPVVDELDVVLGVITIDDVVDVVVQEASEDILKLSGTTGDGFQTSKFIQGSIFYALIHRLPWLMVTIAGGLLSSFIVIKFSEGFGYSVISLSFLLSFLPLLMGLAGNIGNQSATILVRALAVHQIDASKSISSIGRETLIGMVIGLFIGLAVFVLIFVVYRSMAVAICLGLTILFNMTVASFIGASLPLGLKALSIDPAVASAPFISTSLDIIGQIIYFATITLMVILFL